MKGDELLDAINAFARKNTIDETRVGYIIVVLDADKDGAGVLSNIKNSALSRIFNELSIQSGTRQ